MIKSLTNEEIASLRVDYTLKRFDEDDVHDNPIEQFRIWFNEAVQARVNEPNAMTLATVKSDLTPSARIVLLKGVHDEGFTFFTNYHSRKGQELEHNPNVAAVFCWLELQRQVRIEGTVTPLSDRENDEYFYSRPAGSQAGAIASFQSRVLESREELEQRHNAILAANEPLTRPAYWGGYLIRPVLIEFWQGRSSRLHDRLEFKLNKGIWIRNRLSP